MIEEIAKFITLVMKLKDTGEPFKAYEEVKKMTEKLTGISYDGLMSGNTGASAIKVKKGDPTGYLDAKGQFFFTAGELCLDLNKRAEAQKLFETSLFFYTRAEEKHQSFSFQRQVDMSKIFDYLDRMAAPQSAEE